MATSIYSLHVYILLYGQRLVMVIWQYENPTSEKNALTYYMVYIYLYLIYVNI